MNNEAHRKIYDPWSSFPLAILVETTFAKFNTYTFHFTLCTTSSHALSDKKEEKNLLTTLRNILL
ncbi:MAG: hypothetical protein ACI8RD_003417 [Bacillariaceae sp.]|jgi:hypothetical protein